MSWIIGPLTDVVIARLASLEAPGVRVLDTWTVTGWCAELDPVGAFEAWLDTDEHIVLDPADRYFVRLIDVGRKMTTEEGTRQSSLIAGLNMWLYQVPGAVMNRPSQIIHNGSKSLHEHVIVSYGLRVPPSLTSADKLRLADFAARHPSIVKTLSGVRARARTVTAADFEGPRHFDGPVHVQQFIDGRDVRVHVVDDAVFALEIDGRHVDYRHAETDGQPIQQGRPIAVPAEVKQRIVAASREMALPLAGWDFKIDDQNEWWCLEANPMPAFSPYDKPLDGAISRQVFAWLEGR
jgi:hypothetical protein